MRVNLKKTLLFIPILAIVLSSCAGTNRSRDLGSSVSPSINPHAKIDYKQKADRSVYFIKADTKGTLYGNPCMEEVTSKMGFYYLIVPKKDMELESQTGIFFHNLGTSFTLFIRQGPFWKWKLKRKLKKCKQSTGDFVG